MIEEWKDIKYHECSMCYTTDVIGSLYYFNNNIELCLDCALENGYIDKQFYVILAFNNFNLKLNKRYKLVERDSTKHNIVLSCEDLKYEVIDTNRKHRSYTKYKEWRINVFKRDFYTCQHCNKVGGVLNAHHIRSYKDYPKLRTVLSNGITLCYECHKEEHKRLRRNK